ncbi:MAG TPA: hypothetical protein VMZ53_11395 [Kofleriaceae bacterium]|nr:hypothetical protein [Kofleriaceae bacterium]
MSFAETANRRFLRSVSGHLGELSWEIDADGYQRLQVPPTADLDILLRLLTRRGLDPALTTLLLDRFANRPLERALIAWDVAAGSLLGSDDGALLERVRAELAPLKKIGTSASVALSRGQVGALIEAVVAVGEKPMSEGSAPQPSLADAATSIATDTAGIEAALAFADRLALAHLPSLSLAFAQILYSRHSLPAALDRIVETALDYERFDSIPAMTESDDRSLQRQTYFGMRVALAQLDAQSAAKMLAEMAAKHPAVADLSHPTLAAVRVELEVVADRPVDYSMVATLEALAPDGSKWRYGSRVRDELRIEVAPQNSALTLDGFISSFGNDLRMWAQAGYHDEVRTELLALASREIRYQSHDPDAWRSLAVFVEDGSPIELELQERLAAQLDAVLVAVN